MTDFLLVGCPDRASAEAALAELGGLMRGRGLELNGAKSRVVDAAAEGGFDFLGYRYEKGGWSPQPDRLEKIRAKVAAQLRRAGQGGRRRAAACLRGWLGYYGRRGRPLPVDLVEADRGEAGGAAKIREKSDETGGKMGGT